MASAQTHIANRGEFIDVLRALSRGRLLVRADEVSGHYAIDGSMVYHSYEALERFGLIRKIDNPEGFPSVQYFGLSDEGREFAQRAIEAWRSRPLVERLAVRLVG